MSSPRMEQVFYNTHSKVSHYLLRHTSHRSRSFIEHFILGLAVCGFCVVLLSHRTFVHREDVAWISSFSLNSSSGDDDGGGKYYLGGAVCNGGGGGISIYSIMVQLARSGYAWLASSGIIASSENLNSWSSVMEKQIPATCLKSIPGFSEDADVTHIISMQYSNDHGDDYYFNDSSKNNTHSMGGFSAKSSSEPPRIESTFAGSRAFTIHKGRHDNELVVTGMPSNSSQHSHSCIIDTSDYTSPTITKHHQRTTATSFGFSMKQTTVQEVCPPDIISLLSFHGHLPSSPRNPNHQHYNNQQHQHSPIIYSYSHSQGLLFLPPTLLHAHNITTQFILPSPTDPKCFGEPFVQTIIFKLVGPDTVMLNWILGLQGALQHHSTTKSTTTAGIMQQQKKIPRFVHHWRTRKDLDLDLFDMDHYAFSSSSSATTTRKSKRDNDDSSLRRYSPYDYHESSTFFAPVTTLTAAMNKVIDNFQHHPFYRLLRFLKFKLLVLLSTLFIFFLTTSLVSFTFTETQDRMLEFTLQLQTRVRMRLPLGGLIVGHVLENLVFVPIMVGMIFFLIEFYGGDKFLAFMVLSMVWVSEVFSAISIRSIQGVHFFPRVFFLYFTLFHVYFFSCPIGFTYTSLLSTILFMLHTMLFFWNRYELPALHAGLITPQSPRMTSAGVGGVGINDGGGDAVRGPGSPPQIPHMMTNIRPRIRDQQQQQQPHQQQRERNDNNAILNQLQQPDLNDDHTSTTAPLSTLASTHQIIGNGSSSITANSFMIDDNTPISNQLPLPPAYPTPMSRFVAAASTSLQSIHTMTSNQSLSSFAERAERTSSPNWLFSGGYGLITSNGTGDSEDDDSYMAYVGDQRRSALSN